MNQYDFFKTPGVPRDPNYFSEVVEGPECLSCFYIFLYDICKTPGVPGAPKHISEVVEVPECLSSL